jgi:hypothetical protein
MQPTNQINIELGEKEAEGLYSNLVLISHSAAEFVMDFTRMLPGVPKSRVYARIIMAPIHAKLFAKALQENIEAYEKDNGEIKISPNEQSKNFGFQISTPEPVKKG